MVSLSNERSVTLYTFTPDACGPYANNAWMLATIANVHAPHRLIRVRMEGDFCAPNITSATPPRSVRIPANMTKRMMLNRLFRPCLWPTSLLRMRVTSEELVPIENAKDPCTGWESAEATRHTTTHVPSPSLSMFARTVVWSSASRVGFASNTSLPS